MKRDAIVPCFMSPLEARAVESIDSMLLVRGESSISSGSLALVAQRASQTPWPRMCRTRRICDGGTIPDAATMAR